MPKPVYDTLAFRTLVRLTPVSPPTVYVVTRTDEPTAAVYLPAEIALKVNRALIAGKVVKISIEDDET